MKKILSIVLILILLTVSITSPVAAAAAPSQKEEVIYGILQTDGSVNRLYVVNIFNEGNITDYGNYSKISNLTNSELLTYKDGMVTHETKAERFYYQGNLEVKELPWNIEIKYYMDDKEVSGTELAGMSGRLKITLSVTENTHDDRGFYDNYALQIALSLDSRLCSNIKADAATIAEAGGNKQLSFTVLPGKPMEADVTADVKDFELEPITISAIRLNLGIDIDLGDFTGQITELITAVEELDDGAGQLLEGLNRLSAGMNDYVIGLKAFQEGIGQLSAGAGQLDDGASALAYGLSELTKQNDALVNGALTIQQSAFEAINAQLAGMGLGLPALTPDNYSQILSPIPDLTVVKLQLDGIIQFTQGVKGYTSGVAELGKGASELADGTAKFKASSSEIAASIKQLYDAGARLNTAVKEIQEGLAAYKEGTGEFRDKTSDMDEAIEAQVDELLAGITGTDDRIVSFVSDKNTEITAVQFVLKTEPIHIPEAPKAVKTEPVKLNFWQKLLKLFGLYKG